MFPNLLSFEHFNVPSKPFIVFAGGLLSLVFFFCFGKRLCLHWKILLDGFIASALGGLLLGRLTAVLGQWGWFHSHLSLIGNFTLWGIDIYGGIVGGLFGMALIAYWYDRPYFEMTDLIAVFMP